MFTAGANSPIKNTDYRVVLPFYAYAALSFLVTTLLMMADVSAFTQHHFNPKALAIKHTMALGWGTMMILGASHQLFPVLIEGKLHSNLLAYLSFMFGATGIPMLVYAFYLFNFGLVAQIGAVLINLAVISYLTNTIDGRDVFTECGLGLSQCSSTHPCPIHDQYKVGREILQNIFTENSINVLCDPVGIGITHLIG